MQVSNLILDLFREKWFISQSVADAFKPNILNVLNGKPFFLEASEKPTIKRLAGKNLNSADELTNFNDAAEGDIAIISMSGPMTRYGDMCHNGTEDIAALVREADSSPNIKATILSMDSPGGTTSSILPLKSVMRDAKKPIVALVNGNAESAAYFVASYADKIMAIDEMSQIGSIGTVAIVLDDREKMKTEGVAIKYVYPKNSSFKNAAERQFMEEGKTDLLEQELEVWSTHFQNVVRANRKGIDETVPGILEGAVFTATDAVKNGLIDSIGNMDDAIAMCNKLADKYKKMQSTIN